MPFVCKRIQDGAATDDGIRVLVDRLWPRGMSKERASLDLWLKEIAPSTDLRKWFAHDPEKWEAFKARYFAELDASPAVVERLSALGRTARVTLLYSARDEQHNNAAALCDYLQRSAGLS